MNDESNFLDELERQGQKKVRKTKVKTEARPPVPVKKEDNLIFTVIVAVIIVLGVLGLVFGYTKNKLSELRLGADTAKGLENQVASLQEQLNLMQEKAESLEKQSLSNKEVVLDLFEKNRSLPDNFNANDWQSFGQDGFNYTLRYPNNWEVIIPAGAENNTQLLTLQPKGDLSFVGLISLQSDYGDFAKLKIAQKEEVFADLDLIDRVDTNFGTLLYFINLDKENREVPTVLILTADNIYKASFNITDKKLDNYFEYRKNFEEIISTFAPIKAGTASKTPEKK